jgi:hypothetical protein
MNRNRSCPFRPALDFTVVLTETTVNVADRSIRIEFETVVDPRVPPVICSAEVGWYITTRERMKTLTFNLGNHGYDPAAPEMAAVFVAEGPAFARGRSVRPFDNVDVQPLMAHLLHLNAPKSDGSWRTFKGVLSAH